MNAGAGMIERGQDFRLPLKAAHSLGISDKLLRHDLQRDLPAETSVRIPLTIPLESEPSSPLGFPTRTTPVPTFTSLEFPSFTQGRSKAGIWITARSLHLHSRSSDWGVLN